MVLHREGGDVKAAEAFDHLVVEAHVGDLDSAEFFVGGSDGAVQRGIYGEAMVLGGDFYLAGGAVHDGLVDTAVAEWQLVGAKAQGAAQQLVAEADTEEGVPVRRTDCRS